MVTPWKKNRQRLEELERRIAALEEEKKAKSAERTETPGVMAIPADIIAEWLNGGK